MVSFDAFVIEDGSPIYLQIILYIKRCIIGGTIADGDELPSRRVLSALLGVNPNTIQKAYKMLEDEGLIQSHSGAKSYVAADPDAVARVKAELLENDVLNVINAMKQTGLSKGEALALIEKYWE